MQVFKSQLLRNFLPFRGSLSTRLWSLLVLCLVALTLTPAVAQDRRGGKKRNPKKKKNETEADKDKDKEKPKTLDPKKFIDNLVKSYSKVKTMSVKITNTVKIDNRKQRTVVDVEWMRPNKKHIIVKEQVDKSIRQSEFLSNGKKAWIIQVSPRKVVKPSQVNNSKYSIYCSFLLKMLEGKNPLPESTTKTLLKKVPHMNSHIYKLSFAFTEPYKSVVVFEFNSRGRIMKRRSRVTLDETKTVEVTAVFGGYLVNEGVKDEDFEIDPDLRQGAEQDPIDAFSEAIRRAAEEELDREKKRGRGPSSQPSPKGE